MRLRRHVALWPRSVLFAAVALALAAAAVAVCASAASATAPSATASPTPTATATPEPRIEIASPSAYQVVQRGAAGRATIVVKGTLTGVSGPVQVRWSSRAWFHAACSKTGRFTVRMPRCRQGQGTIFARAARRHSIHATVPFVGVGDIYVIAGQSNASGRGKRLNYAVHPRAQGRPVRQRRPLGAAWSIRPIARRGRSTR